MPFDTEGSPHIPSFSGPVSSSQTFTNTDDVLGALKYARATSFATMFLVCPLLDFPVAALLTMCLTIFIRGLDLLNSFATSRLRYRVFTSSGHLTSIGNFPVTSLHFWTGTFLYTCVFHNSISGFCASQTRGGSSLQLFTSSHTNSS